MTVKEMYVKFSERIPDHLREEWDNDGLMCCPDGTAEVNRVLITLDVTEEVVDYAIESAFDLIISHHPLIFKPLKSVVEDNSVSRKVIKLLNNGISVFSFHTRADKVTGGVNDKLAEIFKELRLPYVQGRVWTTDAIYRETKSAVAKRKNDGCIAVEMELAGMQAVCDFHEIELYDFLVTGDVLDTENYTPDGLDEANHSFDKFYVALKILEKI